MSTQAQAGRLDLVGELPGPGPGSEDLQAQARLGVEQVCIVPSHWQDKIKYVANWLHQLARQDKTLSKLAT